MAAIQTICYFSELAAPCELKRPQLAFPVNALSFAGFLPFLAVERVVVFKHSKFSVIHFSAKTH